MSHLSEGEPQWRNGVAPPEGLADRVRPARRGRRVPRQESGRKSGLGEVEDRRVRDASVDLDRAVPGQGLVGADLVELDPVFLGLADQVQGVIDGLAVEPLVLQRLEPPLSDTVLTR